MPDNSVPLDDKCAHTGDRSRIFIRLLIDISCGNPGARQQWPAAFLDFEQLVHE